MYKIHIITFGCTLNQADSEIMAGILKASNFVLVDTLKESDLVIINSCTVKLPTINNFKRTLDEVKSMGKKIVIAGCIPQANQEMDDLYVYPLIGTDQIYNIVDVIENAFNGISVHALSPEKVDKLSHPFIRKNNIIELIPICKGCLGNCSYCQTKLARGELFSYNEDLILNRVNNAVKAGVREIWLTAQDTGAYGKDIKTNLVKLLRRIISVKGEFKVRLGMLNPEHLEEIFPELMEIYKSDKMFKFIHIPVQSGSDETLKQMHRNYTSTEFFSLVSKIRSIHPDMTIATDVICGFPTETEDDFNETLKLIKSTCPDIVNISRFWPRPGTKAAKLKQLTGDIIKDRSTRMTFLFNNISRINNEKWWGWVGEVIIDTPGEIKDTFQGHNYAYKTVVVESKQNLIGRKVKVRVKKAVSHYIIAEILYT